MKNTVLKLDLAERPVRIDLNMYTADKAFTLFETVAQIRIDSSAFAKFPKEEKETDEDWRTRIREQAEKDQVRKKGEEMPDYLKRIFDAKHEQYQLAFKIMNAITKSFGLEEITEERFKSGNWMSIKRFIYDVLSLGDVPCEDFAVRELDGR